MYGLINGYLHIALCIVLYFYSFNKVTAQPLSDMNGNHLNLPLQFPLISEDFIKVSSAFGYRMHPIFKKWLWHEGIDLVAQKGKPVYATAQGTIIKSAYENGYGNHIVIAHLGEVKTLYGHLWIRMVNKNEEVYKGQLIGYVGSSGEVTGPHLHYEIWFKNIKVDPMLVWKNQFALIQENNVVN
jgi:murein DD-endopeptidase MepM/ murein hydrolase activator NlpD